MPENLFDIGFGGIRGLHSAVTFKIIYNEFNSAGLIGLDFELECYFITGFYRECANSLQHLANTSVMFLHEASQEVRKIFSLFHTDQGSYG